MTGTNRREARREGRDGRDKRAIMQRGLEPKVGGGESVAHHEGSGGEGGERGDEDEQHGRLGPGCTTAERGATALLQQRLHRRAALDAL